MLFFSASINQCDSARSVSKALENRMTSSLFLWTMETVAEIIHNFSHQNLPCESFIFRSQLNFLWTLTLPFKKTMVPLVSVSFWASVHWKWTVTWKALSSFTLKYCPLPASHFGAISCISWQIWPTEKPLWYDYIPTNSNDNASIFKT